MYHWNYFWTFLICIIFKLTTSSGNTQRADEATERFNQAFGPSKEGSWTFCHDASSLPCITNVRIQYLYDDMKAMDDNHAFQTLGDDVLSLSRKMVEGGDIPDGELINSGAISSPFIKTQGGLIAAFDRATRDIRSAKDTVNEVQQEYSRLQSEGCRYGAPNNHGCLLAIIDSRNPGRRSSEELDNQELESNKKDIKPFEIRHPQPQSEEERLEYIAKLAKRRKDMDRILELLDEKETSIKQLKKRTCDVELSGACRTEWASAIADQYYYLMGPHGPGKRRKRSLLSVLKGKLSHISNKH